MTGWQPIETAPKDGSQVLIYIPTLPDRIHTARFVTKFPRIWNLWPLPRRWYSTGSRGWWALDVDLSPWPATHWMELPERPE